MTPELASGVHRRERRLPLLDASTQSGPTFDHVDTGKRALYPLGRGARRVLVALVRSLSPPSPAPRDAALLAKVTDGALLIMRHMHPLVSRALSLALLSLDWAPLAARVSWRRLHRLPATEARVLMHGLSLHRWAPIRTLVGGLRSLVLGVYFDQPEVHEAIGYAPAVHIAERAALRRSIVEGAAFERTG